MKCPNCAAEVQGKFCDFCGSEMPQEKETANTVNNYYYATSQEKSESEDGAAICPQCGKTKITFKRERVGTVTQASSRKKYVGSGRKGQAVSQTAYRTVGVCQNCGYTWCPDASTNNMKPQRKTWLWVLGWICIFPVPLTILLLRKKEMKPAVKYGIIAAAWVLYLIIGLFGNVETEIPQTDVIGATILTEQSSVSEIENTAQDATEDAEQLIRYYDRDETVNLYLNRFNAANPDQMITSDLFEVYYHHGKEHDDQIIFTRDEVEVVITGNSLGSSIKLVIDGSADKTADDYKLLFFQYARAFSLNLIDDKLETYWQAVRDDIINSAEFDEFDCSLHTYNDAIEYMIIEGKIQ